MSIECNGRMGTLSAMVISSHFPGDLFLLCAYHVLDDGDANTEVRLPSAGNATVATYTRNEFTSLPDQDAAIARITVDNPFENFGDEVPSGDYRITRIGGPMEDRQLIKFGATTHITQSTVSRVFNDFDNGRGFVELKGNGVYCADGDSGALWRDERNGRAIAMHIQGNRPGNTAIASPLIFSFTDLGLALAQPATTPNNQ